MIDFKIENRKYSIKNITIQDYYNIKTTFILDDLEGKYQILNYLSGCPLDDLVRIPYNELIELFALLEIMLEKSLVKQGSVINKIQFKGVEYGLVDFDKMTLGEFVDLDIIVNDEKSDNRLHEILAILYRPIKNKRLFSYEIEDYDSEGFKERCKLFLELPLKYAKSATAFFLCLDLAYLGAIETFSNQTPKQNRRMMKKINKVLQETGTISSLLLQIKIRLKLVQLQNFISGKFSTFYHGGLTIIKNLKKKTLKMFVKYNKVK
jgi:hypothetical protein